MTTKPENVAKQCSNCKEYKEVDNLYKNGSNCSECNNFKRR